MKNESPFRKQENEKIFTHLRIHSFTHLLTYRALVVSADGHPHQHTELYIKSNKYEDSDC